MSDPNCYCESYYSYVCLSCRARPVREAESRPEADESLRIAAALAECAPTVEDRYNWSAKDHAELPALVAALRERAEKAERERDEALRRIASVLDLQLPTNDPVRAIELDIKCLLDIAERWGQACALAREHCPVGDGESHIRQGIPRLAKKCAEAIAERDRLRSEVEALRARVVELEGAELMVEAARRILSSVAEAMTEHAYQELALALESPARIAGKTAGFDQPGREHTVGDALGLRRGR